MQKELRRYIHASCLLFLSIFSCYFPAAAQDHDMLYMVDETPVKGKLVEIMPKKVKYESQAGKVRTYDAIDVLMVFNKAGNFLIFPPLQITPETSEDFIHSGEKSPLDLLVTLNKQVIPASIISADEKEVLYQDARDKSGERSIGKDILAVIIFKNGQHELLVSPSQARDILTVVNPEMENIKKQFKKTTLTAEQPAIKPEPEVAKKTAKAAPINSAGSAVDQKKAEMPIKAEAKNKALADPASSTESLAILKEAALKKLQDLTAYMGIIANAQTSRDQAKATIDMASALFVDEDALIEVSDLRTGAKNKYKVKDYLNRLALRAGQYEKIAIDYANINYATDFVKQTDGKYAGETRYMQPYKGLSGGNISYGELTKRKAVVLQKSYEKTAEGFNKQLWEVFLSDIGVVETQKPN